LFDSVWDSERLGKRLRTQILTFRNTVLRVEKTLVFSFDAESLVPYVNKVSVEDAFETRGRSLKL
jgi:hypothetical protein